MDDVGARLDKATKIGGFKSRRQMAKELGISYSTLNKWVDNNRITEKGALTIAAKIPISTNYLLTGEGEAEVRNVKFMQQNINSPIGVGQTEKINGSITGSVISDDTCNLTDDESIIIRKFRELNDEQKEDAFLEILRVIKEAKQK